MSEADIPAVLEIETQAQPVPWGENIFRGSFGKRYDNWVLESDSELIAFFLISTVLDEAHLMNIAVLPASQDRGIGKELLEFVFERVRANGCSNLFLEVRASNSPAIKLYENAGFNQIGLRRDYYVGPVGREDAAIYAIELPL
jgi:ribosomal-protein-alanine N-acetyltransferase